MEDGKILEAAMNDFLDYERRHQPGDVPWRLYARADDPEEIDAERISISLDAVGADWFDGTNSDFEHRSTAEREFFDQAPLALIEIDLPTSWIDESALRQLKNPPPEEQRPWWSIEIAAPNEGLPVLIYPNLFAAPILGAIRMPPHPTPPRVSAALSRAFSLGSIPDATPGAIKSALPSSSTTAGAIVYDVGQGNCNALVNSGGQPLCYFDFGAAVRHHANTYPSGLSNFCFCHAPPIILSHWDWDHWAAGNICTRAQGMSWIAPRQTLGAVHRTFAQSIVNSGNLLICPSSALPVTVGAITIEHCTGTTKNDSGLAVQLEGVDMQGATRVALLPGDARYTAIPGRKNTFRHIVSPHHGATLASKWTPTCPGTVDERLVHSCGNPNQWNHPTTITRQRHDSTGWNDTTVNSTAHINLTRETTNRTNGFGHVFLPWDPSTAKPQVRCCGTVTISPTQT